jgi:hypothetical protein
MSDPDPQPVTMHDLTRDVLGECRDAGISDEAAMLPVIVHNLAIADKLSKAGDTPFSCDMSLHEEVAARVGFVEFWRKGWTEDDGQSEYVSASWHDEYNLLLVADTFKGRRNTATIYGYRSSFDVDHKWQGSWSPNIVDGELIGGWFHNDGRAGLAVWTGKIAETSAEWPGPVMHGLYPYARPEGIDTSKANIATWPPEILAKIGEASS